MCGTLSIPVLHVHLPGIVQQELQHAGMAALARLVERGLARHPKLYRVGPCLYGQTCSPDQKLISDLKVFIVLQGQYFEIRDDCLQWKFFSFLYPLVP